MKSKYNIVLIVTSLLIFLSVSISILNYMVSLKSTQVQLKDQSLPLSLDNIYTEIQKHVVEPYLVSSMMAHDTFVKDWIKYEEKDVAQIQRYLEAIKNKYSMFSTFLVSNETKNYYTQSGFIETMQKDNIANKWFFDFKQIEQEHEINLDINKNLSNNLIMFINYKIFDEKYHVLGITGVAIKISYMNEMLKKFRLKHKFKVFFVDKNGDIVLSEQNLNLKNIADSNELKKYKDDILSNQTISIEYEKNDNTYLLQTKYIPELDLNLLVEANLNDFTKEVKKVFYINLIGSIFVTVLIALLIYFLIKRYNTKLEHLAHHDSLTGLLNRRSIMEKLEYFMLLHKRNKEPLSIAYLDIDDFKPINDNFGHEMGDKVLKRVATVLKENIRRTDFVARLGGEEFILIFVDTDINSAKNVAEKIRASLENDLTLIELTKAKVTASIGLTEQNEEDNVNTITARADHAMYDAKKQGKNRLILV